MSTLVFGKIKMKAGRLGKATDYPLLFKPGAFEKGGRLDESEGLYLNYGKVMHTLPYSSLDDYDHSEDLREFDAFILENSHLKAVFIPSLGGRLWSLYDKDEQRDLVINNPVFRPCNLALRNAWFSGGVEWNCGVRGHSPLTCDKVYGAMYKAEDGTPILRLYAFERMRAVTFQIDFFLPDDSRNLYARMRLVNGSDQVKPIYWWSTIAVEQKEGARVIVPASETYVNHGSDPVYKTAIPMVDGVDTSYPTNHTEATDHFFKIPDEARKFEAYLDKNGVGIIHASTRRLKGRKMFVWGTSQGGQNWQKALTNKEGEKQPYLEIQAGICYTQNESYPFPPHSCIEWLEAYCPITMAPEAVHGEYETARKNVEAWLDQTLSAERLETMLAETKKYALEPVNCCFKGHPWGALDNELQQACGEKPIAPYLDFGELEDEQKLWERLLINGHLDEPDPAALPASFMVQDEWFALLKKSVKSADKFNWNAWYHLGICFYAREDYDRACEMFERSLELKTSTWAYHGLGCAKFSLGEAESGAQMMMKALELNSGNLQLAKEAMRLSCLFGQYRPVLRMLDLLSDAHRADPLIQGFYAMALAHTGELERAKAILEKDGGLQCDDLREGDDSITSTYIFIVKELAKREGREISDCDVTVPQKIDFRMFH